MKTYPLAGYVVIVPSVCVAGEQPDLSARIFNCADEEILASPLSLAGRAMKAYLLAGYVVIALPIRDWRVTPTASIHLTQYHQAGNTTPQNVSVSNSWSLVQWYNVQGCLC